MRLYTEELDIWAGNQWIKEDKAMWKIEKENSQDLGFAIHCLFFNAIDMDEFKLWLQEVIKITPVDKIPYYFYDLVDFDEPLFHISNVIGFVPDSNLSPAQDNALTGIAYLRGVDIYDPPVSKEKALTALKKNPQIMKEFKRFFPFVKFESE